MIISRLLEGDFFDYHKVIAFPEKSEVKVNAAEFIASLDRSLLLISERMKSPVVCSFEKGRITVKCKTGLGRINEKIPAEYEGSEMEIAFYARYMIDAVKNCECDEVKIQLTTPLSPVRIMQPDGDEYTAIVLPVRQKADYN